MNPYLKWMPHTSCLLVTVHGKTYSNDFPFFSRIPFTTVWKKNCIRSNDLVTRSLETPTRSNDLVTRSIETPTRLNDLFIRSLETLTRSNDFVTRLLETPTRSNDLVTRLLETPTRSNDLVTRTSKHQLVRTTWPPVHWKQRLYM